MIYLRCAILWLTLAGALDAAGLDDLNHDVPWKSVAQGVWIAELGDMSQELRYTDLAASAPRLDALNNREDDSWQAELPFPFASGSVGFRLMDDYRVMVRMPLEEGEQIYGYGLQFDGSEKTGTILELKVDHFDRGGGATHAPVPFYLSSKGYGVFFNTAKYLKVHNGIGNRKDSKRNPLPVDRNPPSDELQPGPWLAEPPGDAVEAWLHGKGIELVVFRGTSLLEVVAKYNLYCGGGAMPPLWGLGFWHRVPSDFSAEQTLAEVEQFRLHQIPLDVIGLEPGWQTKSYPCTFQWQKKRFPDPQAFTQSLLKRGVRLNLWENPYISPDADIYAAMYGLSGSHLVWLGLVPDYTIPQTREILTTQHQAEHFDIGISGYKIDEVDGYDQWLWPDHATFPSGTSAEVMRQTYGMQLQSTLYHGLFRKLDQRTYGLVRASNGGASGYPFVIYSDSYGHAQYIHGLATASLAGILWCPEIRSAENAREWLNRMHTVCFSPLAMLNAWASGQKPWSFPSVTDSVREVIELRMRLLPYLYSAFSAYHRQGIPPVRSLLLEPLGSGEMPTVDDTMFMFGPSILVAPFYERQATERTIRLPRGDWYDFYSGALVGNGVEITRTADGMQNRVPLFVRDGAVIPLLTSAVSNTDAAFGQGIEVRHYGKSAGNFLLYEDDGKSFAYERGESSSRRLAIRANGEWWGDIAPTAAGMFGPIERFRRMSVESASIE